jgi:hypothetical protein
MKGGKKGGTKERNELYSNIAGPLLLVLAVFSTWEALNRGHVGEQKYGSEGTAYAIADVSGAAVTASSVYREFSSQQLRAGETLTVTLNVIINGDEDYYAIEERVPAGWLILSDGGGGTAEENVLKWVVIENAHSAIYSYEVKAPNQPATYSFSGVYHMEGMADEDAISGSTDVSVAEECQPSVEVCDGIDNDCDDSIDENLTRQCGTTDIGECKYGVQTCNNGEWSPCVGNVNPQLEICDGLDNNCDGSVDEDFTTEDCEALCLSAEACQISTCDYNPSRSGIGLKCCGDNYDETPYEETETSCADGHDNDCDGLYDIDDADCGCQSDADCDYLDNDYCNIDLIMHDEGKCINSTCIVETSTIYDCNNDNAVYCSGTKILSDDYTCQNAVCVVEQTAIVEECDDGVYCNGIESCYAGECVAGSAVSCDDLVECTEDVCEEGGGTYFCNHIANDSKCSPNEVCAPVYFPPPSSGCGEILNCTGQPDGTLCDDGVYCNGIDECQGGVCVNVGLPLTCNDNKTCTLDSCNEAADACIFEEIDNDGDGFGVCSGLNYDCNDSNSSINPAAAEDCANGVDDDCDSFADIEDSECFECTPGDNRSCPKQEGVCSGSYEICDSDGRWSGCSIANYSAWNANYETTETLCDGLDNDCDGSVDEECGSGDGSNGGGSGGGGSGWGGICKEVWKCGSWSECKDNGQKTRVCTDINNCGTTRDKPKEIEACIYEGTCEDGLKNGNEEGIDCGGRCPVECNESAGSSIEIVVHNINAEILDAYNFKVAIKNRGTREVRNLKVGVSKWSNSQQTCDSILPSQTIVQEFTLHLPPSPTEESLEVYASDGNSIIASRNVSVRLEVPSFTVKLKKGEEGDIYSIIIFDNREGKGRRIMVEYTIEKDNEVYFYSPSQLHNVKGNEVYYKIEKIRLKGISPGNYDVKSKFYEDGELIGNKITGFAVAGTKKDSNAAIIFYIIIAALIAYSLYTFYAVIRR